MAAIAECWLSDYKIPNNKSLSNLWCFFANNTANVLFKFSIEDCLKYYSSMTTNSTVDNHQVNECTKRAILNKKKTNLISIAQRKISMKHWNFPRWKILFSLFKWNEICIMINALLAYLLNSKKRFQNSPLALANLQIDSMWNYWKIECFLHSFHYVQNNCPHNK